jgi:hypothetical protein
MDRKIYLSIYIYLYLSIYPSIYIYVYIYIYIIIFFYIYIYMYIYIYVYIFVYILRTSTPRERVFYCQPLVRIHRDDFVHRPRAMTVWIPFSRLLHNAKTLCRNPSPRNRRSLQSFASSFGGPILCDKAFKLKLSGNEVYLTNSPVNNMLCSKLHCQKVSI